MITLHLEVTGPLVQIVVQTLQRLPLQRLPLHRLHQGLVMVFLSLVGRAAPDQAHVMWLEVIVIPIKSAQAALAVEAITAGMIFQSLEVAGPQAPIVA